MRTSSVFVLTLYVLAAGCGSEQAEDAFGNPQAEPLVREGRTVIDTPEIIRILEEESIEWIMTNHSQTIFIHLKDGHKYEGRYVQAEAGEYSDHRDIANLVEHIRKKRLPEEGRDWQVTFE